MASILRWGAQGPYGVVVLGATMEGAGAPDGHWGPVKETTLVGWWTYSVSGLHGRECDRTTSQRRGLSPKIILGILDEARIHKHNTYKHTIPYEVEVKVNVITYYFHVLELQEVKLQRIL
jgi:hypothetical protein